MYDQLYRGDDGNALRFYYLAPRNNFQSEKTGSPKFDKALMVDVMTPGANESAPTFELEREYCPEAGIASSRSEKYSQYEKQIEAFKRSSGEDRIDGVPLASWPQIDVAQVATLKAQSVFTVEQLSEVSDGNLDKLGLGARVLRDQAKAYLQTRQFGVPTAQMAANQSHLETENARLRDEVSALSQRLAALTNTANEAAPAPPPPPVDLSFGTGTGPLGGGVDLSFGTASTTPPPLI